MAATERPFVRLAVRLASLLVALSGCAAESRDQEGLYIADAGQPFGFTQAQQPATGVPSTGQPGTGQPGNGNMDGTGVPAAPGARACISADVFSARVSPRFTTDCLRCHDGTKGKATQLLDLTALATGGLQQVCDGTLATTNQADPAASTILTFLDPDDPSTTHDFKYATSAEFAAYRDDVLAWLAAE